MFTQFTGTFGLNASIAVTEPIFEGLVQEFSATAHATTRLLFDFSNVAAADGKLRFSNLAELANLRVEFDGDPLYGFEAIAHAALQIPGLEDAQGDAARIELIGGAAEDPATNAFLFELRTGTVNPLPLTVSDQDFLASYKPAAGP